MRFITRSSAAEAMNSLGTEFDAHAAEARVLRLHPVEFAEEILRFRTSGDVLKEFSRQFAMWLDREFTGQIAKTSKVTSLNLGDRPSENQQWTKLVPVVS